ncbi:hypothetical protein SRABI118_01532 [Massilia sp. Bi118]|nr:hypothetical protein SRABI118_01532 [Massilia sp. Bi118]
MRLLCCVFLKAFEVKNDRHYLFEIGVTYALGRTHARSHITARNFAVDTAQQSYTMK